MDDDIRIIDLCAGIGGFSLGFERADRAFRTVAFCEQNQFCQQILEKHWPKVPIFDDIKTFGYEGEAEIITAGLPCQPFSTAGRQKGTADDRHLWPFMLEIIKQKRPRFIVIENVPGLINLGYDEVCVGLEAENYAASTLLFPACAVGAPHLRNRLFIIGVNVADTGCFGEGGEKKSKWPSGDSSRRGGGIHAGSTGLYERTVADPQCKRQQPSKHERRSRLEEELSARSGEDVADTDGKRGRCGDASGQDASDAGQPPGRSGKDPGGMEPWRSRPGIRGIPDGFSYWLDTVEPPRITTGKTDRKKRLEAFGNAVVPQAVSFIAHGIIKEISNGKE